MGEINILVGYASKPEFEKPVNASAQLDLPNNE